MCGAGARACELAQHRRQLLNEMRRTIRLHSSATGRKAESSPDFIRAAADRKTENSPTSFQELLKLSHALQRWCPVRSISTLLGDGEGYKYSVILTSPIPPSLPLTKDTTKPNF